MHQSIKVLSVEPFTRWMDTRFPFRYGIAAMTRVPHLFLRVTVDVGGKRSFGICSEGLPPKWFTKDPDTTFEEDLPDLVGVIRHAAETAVEMPEKESLFAFWKKLYAIQEVWAMGMDIPPLLANLGVSLMERAVIDATCRAVGRPFHQVLCSGHLGLSLEWFHSELEGKVPTDFLAETPVSKIGARHTIGLGDALIDADIPEEDRAKDDLPQALEDCIRFYGLKYFKIKICGDLAVDRPRLLALAEIFNRECPDYRATLDGNEQFTSMAHFRSHWEELLSEPGLQEMLSPPHLLFVEQPIHRDMALSSQVPGDSICIIDESDAELSSLKSALSVGYSGTSHKNCKGVFKGIANACLLEHLRRENPEETFVLSGEDLGNCGPVTLLQDLAVMATLQLGHVERNGHHYFKGLSVFPVELQELVVENHKDLYAMHKGEFASLKITDGQLNLKNVLEAPFGTFVEPDDHTMSLLGEPGWPV